MVQETAFSKEMQSLKKQKASDTQDKAGKLTLSGWSRYTSSWRSPGTCNSPSTCKTSSHSSKKLSIKIKHYHEKVNELQSNGIWILGCSSAVSSHIYKCLKCRKFRRCTEEQKMEDLPEYRIQMALFCGMDCFGPFYVTDGRRELKCYGLLLTCMCSRDIHIEMLEELSTECIY